jgi:NTE family protein
LFNDGFVFSSESTAPMTSRLTPAGTPRRPNKRIALVLQGGGALGAYQAGVYQALDEHGLCPDWVVGTSIGAINGALIAGNAPSQRLERLKQFWLHVSQAEGVNMQSMSDAARQLHVRMSTIGVIAQGVPGFSLPDC